MNNNLTPGMFANVDTPAYHYNLSLLRETLQAVKAASQGRSDFNVHYAVKANTCAEILREVAKTGFGADTVSMGEIKAAVDCGFDPEKIVFAGVGKTDKEIEYALSIGIGCFNVESLPELEVISEIAAKHGRVANVALRVNPNIDAHTHHYITTGLAENKFGISLEMLDNVIERAYALPAVRLVGLHFHIGSQITITQPYEILCNRINMLLAKFAARGIRFKSINVGGGLGIDYDNPTANPIPDFAAYFGTFSRLMPQREGREIHFELGRAIVAQCGTLITRALYVKKGLNKKFAIVDAGMTELIRPALYQAYHQIANLSGEAEGRKPGKYDVVGPICESSDVFGEDIELPEVKRGDILAIRSAGAYGEIMSSHYNCRTLNPSIFAE
jgi:diaminopimelate decarboxylase